MKPIVAIVGRPNVGKSTLFNKLTGTRRAIVHDTPGVTRDRLYGDCEWLNYNFLLVDTGGIEPGSDDVILSTAGPAEVEARLRLAIGRRAGQAVASPDEIRSGELTIDEATYAARLRGKVLDLTFKEFELLKFLAQHPGRVFTRAQLLQEVWGYDYFGGTRTVDVHVRRLRAKLGGEYETLIGTVRNVGYRFVPFKGNEEREPSPAPAPV